ncbi:sugar kinase [Pullulanibacillus sp. KACC 23026]|nr:sugar kinase [Pullulanibacillus sp. KACC 23026]WEG15022.1 sugar kinase [Pullulanibacillus sp. KACC 23026]
MGLFMPLQNKSLERSQFIEQSFGGAESNVAIGLARLGIQAGWMGRLGTDPMGTAILKTLRGEQVDVSRARQTSEAQTGMMLKDKHLDQTLVFYYRRHSAASLMTPSDLDPSYIKQAKILHLTGITPALSPSCLDTCLYAIETAKQLGVKVSLDPNLRLKLWTIEEARKVLLPLIQEVDYFLPGLDELKLLLDTTNLEDILQYLKGFETITVIKGAGESNLLLDNGVHEMPFYKVPQVVDPVGAGDGFAAGFLAGIIKGLTPHEAVELGSLVGAMVVQGTGDWEALPTWETVEQLLGKKRKIER